MLSKNDAILSLNYITSDHGEDLDLLLTSALFRREFARVKAELEALPPEPVAPGEVVPVATARSNHMEQERTLRDLITTYGRPPLATLEQEAAAARLQAAMLKARDGRSATDLAGHVANLLSRRAAIEADAAAFPNTPIPDYVRGWFESGEQLAEAVFINQRGRPQPQGTFQTLVDLRVLYGMLRDVTRAEVRLRPELPRDLEERLLGFVKDLQQSNRRPVDDTLEIAPPAPPALDAVINADPVAMPEQ